jgi:VanZ family protein
LLLLKKLASLTKREKEVLIVTLGVVSTLGFMLKLPRIFHHFDKELHALFYFFAAFVLTALYPKKHMFIALFLAFFGVCIEVAQQLSNRLFVKRIHGRFDSEDVIANCKGILFFSIIYICWSLFKKIIA